MTKSRRQIDGYMLTYSGLPSVYAFALTHDALHGASIPLYPGCRGPLDTPPVSTGASLRCFIFAGAPLSSLPWPQLTRPTRPRCPSVGDLVPSTFSGAPRLTRPKELLRHCVADLVQSISTVALSQPFRRCYVVLGGDVPTRPRPSSGPCVIQFPIPPDRRRRAVPDDEGLQLSSSSMKSLVQVHGADPDRPMSWMLRFHISPAFVQEYDIDRQEFFIFIHSSLLSLEYQPRPRSAYIP